MRCRAEADNAAEQYEYNNNKNGASSSRRTDAHFGVLGKNRGETKMFNNPKQICCKIVLCTTMDF